MFVWRAVPDPPPMSRVPIFGPHAGASSYPTRPSVKSAASFPKTPIFLGAFSGRALLIFLS